MNEHCYKKDRAIYKKEFIERYTVFKEFKM